MSPEPARIQRRFVTVGRRQVHYRRAGDGPTLVAIHESPRSSLSLVPLMARLSSRFCVLAPDTPGHGSSDPLPRAQPEIADYAAAMVETLDALGIERYVLYGGHTGASIALELAIRDRRRVGGLVLDGVAAFTETEAAELLARYLPQYEPAIDGTHLVALWARVRDQYLFFPWYRRELAARLPGPMPDAEHLHAGVMEILRAGHRYGLAYAAAFRHKPQPGLAALDVPTLLLAREGDVLNQHIERLGELPGCIERRRVARDLEPWSAAIEGFLAERVGDLPPAPAPPAVTALPAGITRDYVDSSYGQLLVRRTGDGHDGPPLAMLHASPGSAQQLVPLIERLGTDRPVVAFDTLGNGDSDKPPWGSAEIADYAAVVDEALERVGLEAPDVYGSHTGALIALEVALRRPAGVRRLILDGVTLFDERERDMMLASYTPPLVPFDDGSHLLFAWTFLRDQTLFWPWFNRTPEGIRRMPVIDAERLHDWCVELLKSGATYPIAYRAAFRHATEPRLAALRTPTLMAARADDILCASTHRAATLAPGATAVTLPDSGDAVAPALAGFLNGAR